MARVIVVDDEAIVAHMIGLLIEDMGHQPVVAANGAEALELLASSADPPALIISDIAMPDMSGVELARRQDDSRPPRCSGCLDERGWPL